MSSADAGATSDFLGVGWAHPVQPADDGSIAEARYEESVRQAVWLVLATSPGERVMRPDFGCGIHELVFAPNDAASVGSAQQAVSAALLRWEPRIDVLDVSVRTETASTLLIHIEYRVRATNNVFNLVYPFYLDQTGLR
jgi:Bacteriophage baseplate protein W